MSCHLLPFSHIGEIKAVRDFLFPPLKDLPCSTSTSSFKDEKSSDGNDWDNDWGDWNETMEDEEREIEPMEEQTDAGDDNGHKWLQDSIVSVSPAADLIAIANDNKMVLLARAHPTHLSPHKQQRSSLNYGYPYPDNRP